MVTVSLTEIRTRDDIPLGGIIVEPPGRKKTALIWLHGLSSAFYHGLPLVRELSAACVRNGIGYFKFNNRGHDIVAKGSKGLVGVAFEDFKKCVDDIRAMILFARQRGYAQVVLAGHSTGANKIVYYLYRTRDRRVKGIILVGGLSDIAADRKHYGKQGLQRALARAQQKVRSGQRNALIDFHGKLYAAHRFVSLYEPGQAEDVFPVYDPKVRWTAMRSVRVPMLVVFGQKDEHLDRSAKKLIELYQSKSVHARQYGGVVMKGADHGFRKKERELASVIVQWIQKFSA